MFFFMRLWAFNANSARPCAWHFLRRFAIKFYFSCIFSWMKRKFDNFLLSRLTLYENSFEMLDEVLFKNNHQYIISADLKSFQDSFMKPQKDANKLLFFFNLKFPHIFKAAYKFYSTSYETARVNFHMF